MEAPDKIWINPSIDLPKLNGIIDKDSVQYVRKDAFMKKACEFISLNVTDYIDVTYKGGIEHLALQEKFIEDFKKYIEE